MPTPAEEMFTEGFGELREVHGHSWSFGSVSFSGVLGQLRTNDPRLPGNGRQVEQLTIATAEVPAGIRKGSLLKRGSIRYTAEQAPVQDASTGLTTILVAIG